MLTTLTERARRARMNRRRATTSLPAEALECRTLFTSVLYLDFGDNFPAGGLDMTVETLYEDFGDDGLQGPDLTDDGFDDDDVLTFTGTQALVNFDYDGSGGAPNAADYTALRAAVLALAQRSYAPFDVNVQIAPAVDNSSDAAYVDGVRDILDNGANTDGEYDGWVFIAQVMESGASVGNTANLNGTSAGEDIDDDNERDDCSITFADVVLGNINATGSDADTRLAYTAAHEGGHDFGMRHTNWGTFGNPAQSSSGNAQTDSDLALISSSDLVVASAPAANRTNYVFNTRWDVVRGDDNNGAGTFDATDTENHYNRLANGGNLGLRAGAPAYVTGTGAFDLITITDAGGGTANVNVQAHRNANFNAGSLIGTNSYSVPTGNGILVEAGASQDRITIDPALGVTVRVRGMAGNDGLVVTGTGSTTGTYTPDTTAPVGLDDIQTFGGTLTAGGTTIILEEFEPAGSITVSGFSSLTVQTGGGNDVINDNTPGAGQTRLSGTVGGIGFVPLTYSGVAGLTIDSGAGNDTVTLDAAVATGLNTLAVSAGGDADTLNLGFGTANPVPAGGLSFDGGTADAGSDLLTLAGGAFPTEVYTASGPSSGTIQLGASTNITYTNLAPIQDSVTVGTMTFNATASAETIEVESGSISGFTAGRIRSATGTFEMLDFANKASVILNALDGADTVNVNHTVGGVAYSVHGDGGDDRINVTGAGLGAGSTVDLSGDADNDTFDVTSSPNVAIPVHGNGGNDTLKVNGQTLTYAMTNTAFTTAGRQPITFDTTELLDVRNGTFTVTGNVGPNVRVQGVEDGPATLNGTGIILGTLTADPGGTVSPAVGAGVSGILGAGSTTLNAGSAFFVDFNGIVPGTNHDQLNVTGSVTINNGTLAGTLNYASIPGEELVIIHNDGADAVVGKFAQGDMVEIGGKKFAIDYAFEGDGDGNLNDVALIRYGAELAPDPCDPTKTALFVSATTGADNVLALPYTGSSRVTVTIEAITQGFTDHFGPFDFDGQIIMMGQSGDDLVSTEAVPSRDVMLYGNVGNDRVVGGNNNGILLGNLGDDTLVGGNARDVMIGGKGADNLAGNNAGDVLVAASTVYDTNSVANRQALCEIMHTWQHGGRMSALLNAATVNDDTEVDVLSGGLGVDWFIHDLNDVLDRAKNEVVSDL